MICLNTSCTDFMFLVVMVCEKYSSTILSFINFNFTLVFKISLLFVKIMSTGFNMKFIHKFQHIERKNENKREVENNSVDFYVMHTVTSRNMNFVQ